MELKPTDIPSDWKSFPHPHSTQKLGDLFVVENISKKLDSKYKDVVTSNIKILNEIYNIVPVINEGTVEVLNLLNKTSLVIPTSSAPEMVFILNFRYCDLSGSLFLKTTIDQTA